jgi:hypothetical protein
MIDARKAVAALAAGFVAVTALVAAGCGPKEEPTTEASPAAGGAMSASPAAGGGAMSASPAPAGGAMGANPAPPGPPSAGKK